MKTIAITLHELSAQELKELPAGFPYLVYDTLYDTLQLGNAGISPVVQRGKRYVFLIYRLPPNEVLLSNGNAGKQG